MKLYAIIGLLLALSAISIASAATEKVSAGPYEVSFDLNTTENHTIEVFGPTEETNESTRYAVMIGFTEQSFGIHIRELKEPDDATLKSRISALQASVEDNSEATWEIGTIDGREGLIGLGQPTYDDQLKLIENISSFQYGYWLDSTKCECGPVWVGKIRVNVVGPWTSEWDRAISNSLLNSLNITKKT